MRLQIIIFFLLNTLFFKSQDVTVGINLNQGVLSGEEVIEKMHQRYKFAPCKTYTFSQKNTHFRNDSIIGNSEWHEAIEFPDKFRIDFGDTTKGNYVIFKNDSSYNYRNFKIKKISYNSNTLLLLLGGMYYRELPEVYTRLKKENYFISTVSVQKFKKHNCYVIGANKGDLKSNQIWVNTKTLRIERIIEQMDENSIMDISFDSYQTHCKGFLETKVTFKRNGKIEQIEEYYNIKEVERFTEKVFDTEK